MQVVPRLSLPLLLVAAMLSAAPLLGETITFPVGTPESTVYGPTYFAQHVDRSGFRFNKLFGSLSINSSNLDGGHPTGGGLYVGAAGTETSLSMGRLDGQPFGLASLTILERNNPTGLRLTLGAVHHESGAFFEEEFAFDLNTSTYDTFDVVAADPRFASVNYVTFVSIESPFVDPSNTNYIIDAATVVLPLPPHLAGDYNDNGTVDAADYAVWRDNLGTSTLLPNDPIGGTIGQTHYDQWRSHFSQSAGAAVSLEVAIPEPRNSALGVLTAVAGTWMSRRTSAVALR